MNKKSRQFLIVAMVIVAVSAIEGLNKADMSWATNQNFYLIIIGANSVIALILASKK